MTEINSAAIIITVAERNLILAGIIIPLITWIIMWFLEDRYCLSDFGEGVCLVIFLVLCLVFLVALIFGCFFIYNYHVSPQIELLEYNAMLIQGRTIQEALNNSTDVVNSELYLRAVEFNGLLSKYEDFVNNPFYKPMRWSMDWQNIPRITFN